ncbi:MAG: hypothetical protein ACK5O9_01325 [Holosporales bacterium]|jgi:hypothetical protein
MYDVAKALMGREIDTFEIASEQISVPQDQLLNQLPYFKGIMKQMIEILDEVGPIEDLETSKRLMDRLNVLVTDFESDFGALHTVEPIPSEISQDIFLGEIKEEVMRNDNFLTPEKIEKIAEHQLDQQRLLLERLMNNNGAEQ